MPRFAFPIPGRSKKQAPPQAPAQQHMTKAHKVLGSTYISIDSAKSWDGASNSGLSVSVSESTELTSHSSGGLGRRDESERVVYTHRDWDDESGVLPKHIRITGATTDSEEECSDYSRVLREQPSTSTIKSWYDKTKQPLSVTQQTSASAMAKGLPPKAQRLLDVENAQATLKNKKKPSRLDLSRLKGGSSRSAKEWDGSMLGNGYINRSPSMVSPKTPASGIKSARQRLQKQPTKENLRKQQVEVVSQEHSPSSGERVSPRCPPNMTELPSLYKHYEQTSFAMIMEQDLAAAAGEIPPHPEPLLEQPDVETSATSERLPSRDRQQQQLPEQNDEFSNLLKSHPPIQVETPVAQAVHAPTLLKQDYPSSTDCGASISSRHTRTSKASKHTEKSFQTADFIDKSVLMLSSDSEDDDDCKAYTELSAPGKRKLSTTSRPTSNISTDSGVLSLLSNPSPKTDDTSNRQSGRTIRRTSTAPVGFLTIPTRFSTSTQATTPSTDSYASPQWKTTSFVSTSTPSIMSMASGSSRETAGAEGYAIEEARAVQVRPLQAPPKDRKTAAEDTVAPKHGFPEPPRGIRESRSLTMQAKGSSAVACASSSTPVPLSLSTTDFYMDKSPSGDESTSTEEHFMGLTRQEQMLITALRQRRESMRKTRQPDVKSIKGHHSKESEATITEESFNFDFPVPPSSKKTSSASASVITIPGSKASQDESDQSVTADGTMFVLSPPPPQRKVPKPASVHSNKQGTRLSEHEQMLLYLDHPGGPALAIREGIMSPETESFAIEGASVSLSPPSYRQSLRRQRSNIETSTKDFSPSRSLRDPISTIEESPPPFPPPTRELPAPPRSRTPESGEGIPRPDSPISSSFPGPSGNRRTINKQMARLSAFGPPKPVNTSGWWGDDD